MARSVEQVESPALQSRASAESGTGLDKRLDTSAKPDKPPSVNPVAARFPFCVVWTPIPIVTWLFPFIGHTAVCTSQGVILDFGPSYTVSVDNMAFGRTTRYLYMSPGRASFIDEGGHNGGNIDQQWDKALEDTARVFRQARFNFCGNNCHEFVVHFLNSMRYGGSSAWNAVTLAALVFFKGRFVSVWAVLWSWLPFFVCIIPMLYFGGWIAAATYAGVVGLCVTWFFLYSLAKGRIGRRRPST